MSDYKLTIGLEVHAELSTKTKMFCNSKNDTEEARPNVNTCPVCLGYPGTLPVINKEAVRRVLRLGVAVGGTLADYTEFDRKNYFYPDIPKGYQISQYKHPLVSGGSINGVKLTRVHLEEDTAKSTHDSKGESLLDFNRAGVPLMELVTEPVMHTGEEATSFAKELQLILIYLGISLANMEKGEMRIEANISVSKDNNFGTKVEVKNINSFRSVGKAIDFEFKRQIELIESGGKVIQETRGWDDKKEETFLQRLKESAHDYRYFPDPDLPKLLIKEISEFSEDVLRESLSELPGEKRERLSKMGLSGEHIEIYVSQPEWGKYFDKVSQQLGNLVPKLAQLSSNYITSSLKKPIDPVQFVEVIKMVAEGELSSRGAKNLLEILEHEGGEVQEIVDKKNLRQASDIEKIKIVAEKIIEENHDVADEYKKGKETSLQYLIGQAMKNMNGSGNPLMIKGVFEELLK